MAKYRVYTNQTNQQVLNLLPPQLQRTFVRETLKKSTKYTVIVFPTDGHEVVRSRVLSKALQDVSGKTNIVVVVSDYTIEAGELARQQHIELLSIKEGSFWTDDSIVEIRQGL